MIRHALTEDLDAIKKLADSNKDSIGFVMRSALAFGIEHRWLLVAEHNGQVTGFAHYRHRRDQQSTLYELCVREESRGQQIGKMLINALLEEARAQGKTCLLLKTPTDLQANGFYKHLGFVKREVQPGKKRDLNVWEMTW
jgi:N-acetylglutamate synthase-like GNAT family acetyltransferase